MERYVNSRWDDEQTCHVRVMNAASSSRGFASRRFPARSGGIKLRGKAVRSGCRPANSVTTGNTRPIQGVGHGRSAEQSRCISTVKRLPHL